MMRCKYPMMINGFLCPCGRCMGCRINRRRIWTTRLLLESFGHSASFYFTLTYDNEHIPAGGNLCPEDMRLFIKRLRKAAYPVLFRYFYCGEYGDKNGRPHYHGIIFGLGPEWEERLWEIWGKADRVKSKGKGIHVGMCELDSVQYVAGYVLKKLTDDNPTSILVPEFHRQSNRPGIGHSATAEIAGKWLDHPSFWKDAPTALRLGRSIIPLGRYLRRKIREAVGSPDGKTPPSVLAEIQAQVSLMQKDFKDAKGRAAYKREDFVLAFGDLNAAKMKSVEARVNIFSERKTHETF